MNIVRKNKIARSFALMLGFLMFAGAAPAFAGPTAFVVDDKAHVEYMYRNHLLLIDIGIDYEGRPPLPGSDDEVTVSYSIIGEAVKFVREYVSSHGGGGGGGGSTTTCNVTVVNNGSNNTVTVTACNHQ